MPIALDDALLGWLVSSAGGGVTTWLRGDRVTLVFRQVVEEAVDRTSEALGRHLNAQQVAHLRAALLTGGSDLDGMTVSNRAELATALHRWTTALDHPEFNEVGYLSQLGLEPARLAEELTDRIIAGIERNGRGGGVLGSLAAGLRHDELVAHLGRLQGQLTTAPTGSAPAGGLPGGTPNFTGREAAHAELRRRILQHDKAGTVVAIHVITGMAGVGKTALALHVAHEQKDRYQDGHFFVDLRGFTHGMSSLSPEEALAELLRQAGLADPEIPPDLAGRQARWRALMAGRAALVLLDNARDTAHVSPLLPMSPGCLVLITSRSGLVGLPGTQPMPLDVLPITEAVALFTRLVDSDRCHPRPVVERVVRLVDCLPLAVEMVAGRMRGDPGLTVADLADNLTADRLDEASPDGGGVRAAFHVSVQHLDETRQRAFESLGLHPGPTVGVPQFAILTGLSVTESARTLRTLTERNLVKPDVQRAGHRRYHLHDLVRDFARELAERNVPDRAAALARLTSWYASALTTFVHVWEQTPADSAPAADGLRLADRAEARLWLTTEQDNVLALGRAVQDGGACGVCTDYAWRLYRLGRYLAADELYRITLDRCRRSNDRAGEAAAEQGLGNVARAVSSYTAAEAHYRAALRIQEDVGDDGAEADALCGLGHVARLIGDFRAAREYYQRAVERYRRIGDQAGEADALRGLAQVAGLTGDAPGAREQYGRMLDLSLTAGDRFGEANALRGLGNVALHAGDFADAERAYRTARTIYRDLGNRLGLANTERGLGAVALVAGDLVRASQHYRQALHIYRDVGDGHGVAHALRGLGDVDLRAGEPAGASRHLRQALRLYREAGDRLGEAHTRWRLGRLAREQSDLGDCREHWQWALTAYEQAGNPLATTVRDALDALRAVQIAPRPAVSPEARRAPSDPPQSAR